MWEGFQSSTSETCRLPPHGRVLPPPPAATTVPMWLRILPTGQAAPDLGPMWQQVLVTPHDGPQAGIVPRCPLPLPGTEGRAGGAQAETQWHSLETVLCPSDHHSCWGLQG